MNARGLTEAELDLLADFTAGVLDPDYQARVARLIATDDRWAIAHGELVDADVAVRSDLRAIAGPISMPPDVAARLDATIADLTHQSRRSSLRPVPSHVRSASSSRTDRSSRWRRAGLAVAGAAAAAVLVVWGLPAIMSGLPRNTSGNAATGSGNLSDARGPEAQALPGGPPTTHSGYDYQPGTLSHLAPGQRDAPQAVPTPTPAPAPPAAGSGATKATSANDSAPLAPGAVDPLARLGSPDALRACLAAIDRVHAGTPSLVDFARFQGAPALVVVVQQPNQVIAVVVGPACGQNGPNELYWAPIGP